MPTAKDILDGGGPSKPIEPYVCPRGHYNVRMGADRFWCETCRRNGFAGKWPKSELVDLREEEPPLAKGGGD